MKHRWTLVALGVAICVEAIIFFSSGFLSGRGTGHDVMPHLLHFPSCFVVAVIMEFMGLRANVVYGTGIVLGQTLFYFSILWIIGNVIRGKIRRWIMSEDRYRRFLERSWKPIEPPTPTPS